MSSPVEMPPPSQYPTLPPPSLAAPPRPPKSPALALFLSLLFPGVGQLYNGQVGKAFAFMGAFVACIYLAAETEPLPYALFLPFILFYGLIDAYRSAGVINARHAAGRADIDEEPEVESPGWGASLLVLGFLLLLNNLGVLRLASLQRFWPLVLMVAGAGFLYRSLKHGKEGGNGPVV